MKYGKSEELAQQEIEKLVNDVFNKISKLNKLPFMGNLQIATTLGVDKFAKAVMKISQKYVEAKLLEMVGKKYVLKIEESGQEFTGHYND